MAGQFSRFYSPINRLTVPPTCHRGAKYSPHSVSWARVLKVITTKSTSTTTITRSDFLYLFTVVVATATQFRSWCGWMEVWEWPPTETNGTWDNVGFSFNSIWTPGGGEVAFQTQRSRPSHRLTYRRQQRYKSVITWVVGLRTERNGNNSTISVSEAVVGRFVVDSWIPQHT